MSFSQQLRRKSRLARRAGPRAAGSALRERFLTTEELMLGLRCRLVIDLPLTRPAKQPLEMHPRDCTEFTGFEDALVESRGSDVLELRNRQRMCEDGVQQLHVATTADGSPAYVQWCVDRSTQPALQRNAGNRYRPLELREVLLEGAYTFPAYRGIGAMADGMGQLLKLARAGGATTALTYVAADNVPSLRGCAKVGFVLDHVRRDRTHYGRRHSEYAAPDADATRLWTQAVS